MNIIPVWKQTDLLEDYFRMCIFGCSKSGKTTYVLQLLEILCSKYQRIVIFTAEYNKKQYQEVLEPLKKLMNKKKSPLDEIILKLKDADKDSPTTQKLIKQMQKLFSYEIFCDLPFQEIMSIVSMIKECNMINSIPLFNYLIILDDVISNKASQNDDFLKLFASSRHYHLSIIYLIQFLTAAYSSDNLKNNCTHLIFCKPNTHESRQILMRSYIETDKFTNNSDDPDVIKQCKKNIISTIWDKNKYAKMIYINGDIYRDPSE